MDFTMKCEALLVLLLISSLAELAIAVRPEKHEKENLGIVDTVISTNSKGSFLNIRSSEELASGPVVDRKQRLAAMMDVIDALNASGVEFVTVYGTTLGLVRDGNLLEWDDDVDFMVADETFHLVRPALEKLRMDMWVRLCAGDMYRAQAEKWGPIDIYRVSMGNPKRDQLANESELLCEWQDQLMVPRSEIFPAKWVQPKGLKGLAVPLPHDPEGHLVHFYGPDWRTPNQHYKGPWNGNGPGRTRPVMKQYHRLCGNKPYRPIPYMEYLEEPSNLAMGTTNTVSMMPVPESALATGLMIPLIIAAWLAWKAFASNWGAPFTLSTYELTFAGLYMSLSASSTLAIRQTQGSALQMTIEACLLLYVMKAVISLGLLYFKQSMTFAEIKEVLQQRAGDMYLPVWCNLAAIGCLFASYDTLSFLAAQNLPPVSFQLMLNCRTLLIVPLQWKLLNKKITLSQFSALLLIAFAACSLGSADLFSFSASNDSKSREQYLVGMLLMCGKVLLSGLGLVINEKLLKELPLTVDAQNLITYSFSMVFLCVGMFFRSLRSVNSHGASVEKDMAVVWGQIFNNAWMIAAVVLMAALGIVCSYLLKAFSAMEKEFLACAVVALLALGQALTPGEHGLTLLSIESGFIILLGCVAYRLSEPPPESKAVAK